MYELPNYSGKYCLLNVEFKSEIEVSLIQFNTNLDNYAYKLDLILIKKVLFNNCYSYDRLSKRTLRFASFTLNMKTNVYSL